MTTPETQPIPTLDQIKAYIQRQQTAQWSTKAIYYLLVGHPVIIKGQINTLLYRRPNTLYARPNLYHTPYPEEVIKAILQEEAV